MVTECKTSEVLQKAYEVCLEIYKITMSIPNDGKGGFDREMRKAAVSVPTYIAEGYGTNATDESLRALGIAYGSNCKLEEQVLSLEELRCIESAKLGKIKGLIGEVGGLLTSGVLGLLRRYALHAWHHVDWIK